MSKEKFDKDWELVSRIDGMAVDYLKKGYSPIETQDMILKSALFQEWMSIERCFDVHFHDIVRFEDLLSNLQFDNYVNSLKYIALQTMQGNTTLYEIELGENRNGPIIIDVDSNVEFDRLFYQIGIHISPKDLGVEIGKICEIININPPLSLLEFLALFTANASGLLSLEIEEVELIKEKETLIEEFKNEFINKYGKKM